MDHFSQNTVEELNFYVFSLSYVGQTHSSNPVYYVGKGKGNRVFQHLSGISENKDDEGDKIELIRSLAGC
jgi:hypothetical protein